jgi:CheY-like chemotaxis protein
VDVTCHVFCEKDCNLKIIVFEDSEPVLSAITCLLKSRGHEVHGFSDPSISPLYDDSACDCPREQPCADVLITDNVMPRITGLEFISRQALKGCKGGHEAQSCYVRFLDKGRVAGC